MRLTGISKSFGSTVALSQADLTLHNGEVHALIGENGAGKSTLLKILSGLLPADSGRIEIGGEQHLRLSPDQARKCGIALINQEPLLCPELTVTENLVAGQESSRWGWLDGRAERRRAQRILDSLEHPEISPESIVGDLSISARQIVEIARGLAWEPDIVLFDEPTSSLGEGDVRRLFCLIRNLSGQGAAIIYISHFLEEVREVADTCTVLRDGSHVRTGPIDQVTDSDLVAAMVGRSIETLFPSRRLGPLANDVILAIDGLSAGDELQSVTFELQRGEILGIAGLAGSGRTRMARALFGLEPASSGTIRLDSRTVAAQQARPHSQLQRGWGYLSEDRKGEGLAFSVSIADNITSNRFETCSRWGWIGLDAQKTQAEKLRDLLDIRADSVLQTIETLSGGNQQKVALARLLHQQARVLLLDEPTKGVDISSKVKIYETIADFARDGGSIILISSYLPELFGMCDSLAVMRAGRLGPARPVNSWTPESVLSEALGTNGR